MADKMHGCGESLPAQESELPHVGLHAIASQTVKPPHIMEAPVAFECVLHEKIETGKSSSQTPRFWTLDYSDCDVTPTVGSALESTKPRYRA
jgi:flavin reductase (DIM6/NTAB) family NADH-FMN oxidoreductase RutF